MRIAFFLTQYMELGGVENVVRELAKRMKKKNKVYLIVRDRPQNTKFEKFWDGVFVIPNSNKFSEFMKSKKTVEAFIKDNKIDIVNFHNTSTVIPFLFSKFKKVLTLHGTMTENTLAQKKYYLTPIYWGLEELVMNFMDQVISITNFHMRYFLVKNLNTVYNGVDTKFFSLKGLDRKKLRKKLGIKNKTGLFVGKFMPIKGLKYLVDVARKIDSNLIIVGDGEERHLTKDIPKNIQYVGPIYDRKKLREYYAACDYLIIPSINEGLPLVLLEALSMRLPVIGTKVGGITEVLEGVGGCILINSKNTNEIRAAIDGIKYRPIKAKVNSWDEISKKTLKIFKE